MQDGPVVIREDVTVSLDKDLINDLLGIAESRETTLSVLVREVLGSFCKMFQSGSDWTRDSLTRIETSLQFPVQINQSGQESFSLLESRVNVHDTILADLQRRITLIEYAAGTSSQIPGPSSPVSTVLQTTLSQSAGQLSAVIDCDEPLVGSVSDEALVRVRKPVSPVMTSVDINSIGRINPEQVYSQTEAAALLHISISTVRKYVKEKRIGSQKIGRSTVFRGKDLLNYLDQFG
jgi:excisionase family DNA binding protein